MLIYQIEKLLIGATQRIDTFVEYIFLLNFFKHHACFNNIQLVITSEADPEGPTKRL